MNTSFWSQGKTRSVYVLELGDVSVAAPCCSDDFIAEMCLWAIPIRNSSLSRAAEWESNASFKTLTGLYTSPASGLFLRYHDDRHLSGMGRNEK
jgi:hypothetical protein